MSALKRSLYSRGALFTSLGDFFEEASEQQVEMLSEAVYEWTNHLGRSDEDTELLESIFLESAAIAGDLRGQRRGADRPEFTGTLWRSDRGSLAMGAVKFALEQSDELVAELHTELGRLIADAEGGESPAQSPPEGDEESDESEEVPRLLETMKRLVELIEKRLTAGGAQC